jgi:hypothetical protein
MKDFKAKQKELTELNADGNEDRNREGESSSKEQEELKKRLEELRKNDPFIYE